MSSSIDPTIPSLGPTHPYNPTHSAANEAPSTAQLLKTLNLQPHIEGGYFAELDRSPLLVPSPFPASPPSHTATSSPQQNFSGAPHLRNASTSIFYYLSRARPQGCFHRNKGRTVHTLIEGRGRYIVIHADEEGEGEKRVETFIVGKDVEKGERMAWVVEGGKYKGSFLLDDEAEGEGEKGLLISETVVPGFEYSDHDFLTQRGLQELVTEEQARELAWLIRPDGEESEAVQDAGVAKE